MALFWILLFWTLLTGNFEFSWGNEHAKRLYDDLMLNYNKLLRPVRHQSLPVNIKMHLSLSQIIDVHEKDQIMTSSVWLRQVWVDHKLQWNPDDYMGIKVLYVPSELLWLPDLVLYNNADSNYNITITTKATVKYDGTVTWEPPAIFKSMCNINVQWFPFDDQDCHLKFGSWSFGDTLMDLQHQTTHVHHIQKYDEKEGKILNVTLVKQGIDISQYYPSVEWDLVELPAIRYRRLYSTSGPNEYFIDITYFIKLRRKPLFYTVNLIIPCVGISFLTIFVFYLPSDSGEKITLCISILVSLTVFFLLLTEIIPATSTVLPLIGKYLLFTMAMVTLSVLVTVVALNLHFRTPTTHRMPGWVKTLFLHTLPKYLLMPRPLGEDDSFRRVSSRRPTSMARQEVEKQRGMAGNRPWKRHTPPTAYSSEIEQIYYSPNVLKAFDNVCFIAELLKKKDRDDKIDEDWKYVAMVLDRLFLWIFSATCVIGTVGIFLQAPAFLDDSKVISQQERTNPIHP